MAISVTTDLTDVSTADTTTSGGTWYRLNGTSSANPAADLDAFVQGTGCIANKCGTTTGTTNTGGHFNHTSTFDLSSGKHLFYWRQIVTPGNMLTKTNQGITLGLTNTTTTSNTTWSTTNYKQWFLDGSDTMPITPGWVPYCLDASQTADASAGTLTLASVKNAGFIVRQNSTITTTVSNQFVDALRAGTGVTLTCSAGGDAPTFSSIFTEDNNVSNRWGVLTQRDGIYYGQGVFTIGATGQSNVCNFTDAGQVFIWRKNVVADTFNKFNLLSNSATNKTTLQITSCVVRGQSAQKWNVACDTNSEFKVYSSSVSNMHTAVLSANSVLDGSSFSVCGQIDLNGGVITGSTFIDCTATSQVLCSSPAEIEDITSTLFTKGSGTTHAIEITGTASSVTLTGLTFSGYAGSNGSTGNEAIYVNIASGTVTLNVSGGSTPSIRTAGATVVVNNSRTLQLTGLVTGSDVVILTNGTTTVRESVDQNAGSTYNYSYTYTASDYIDVCAYKAGYKPWQTRGYLLANSNASLPVSQEADPSYVE